MISIISSKKKDHLDQILSVQKVYLADRLSEEEKKKYGFLTCAYSTEMLTEMSKGYEHIIALDNQKVVGYALVMLKEYKSSNPVVQMMFSRIKDSFWRNRSLSNQSFYTIGQICVDRPYGGQGIFQKLYFKHREVMSPHFDYCITEISGTNARSMRAHLRVGFQVLKTYKDDHDQPWNLVIWDWSD